MTRKVDFLGIGAQRAGTTWLWQNLRQHPSIWLPPRKELHYFDRSPIYPSPSFLASEYLIDRLLGREDHNKRFRKEFIRGLGGAIISKDWEKTRWTLRYFLGTYNDDWYLSLFRPGEGKVKGEITPSYSMLTLKDVKHIRELFPKLKVILILRNPIHRAWSQVRYAWTKRQFNSISNLDKIKKLIDSPAQSLRSDYVRTLGIWILCFPKGQIYIGFYDDIVQDPQGWILDILEFLGVDNTGFSNAETLNKKVNVSRVLEMPAEIKYYLAKKYYPELLKLNTLVGSHSAVWLRETEKILNAAE